MQVQCATRDHDSAVTHATHGVFIGDVVGEGNGRLVRVGPGFGADFQFPVQHDPLGGEFQVGLVGEAEFAQDRQAAQRRRTHVEDHLLACCNGDLVTCAGHPVVRPGGRTGPTRRLDRRRRFNDSGYADEGEGWNEQRKKELSM
jgi:hypothetical protein